MPEIKYYVMMDDCVYAENMTIDTALLLIKALAEDYYVSMKMGCKITLCQHGEEQFKNV